MSLRQTDPSSFVLFFLFAVWLFALIVNSWIISLVSVPVKVFELFETVFSL